MPAKKKIDAKKLIKAVESGKHQNEIMKEFSFNTATQLKNHYLDALVSSGKATEIKSGRGQSQTSVPKEVMVSKRGSVVIPKPLIEAMGYNEGTQFTVRKTKTGISLKMAE